MKHEFKVTKSKEQTVYTLESATGGSSSTSDIASMDSTLGGMQRRNPPGDNILAQEQNVDEGKGLAGDLSGFLKAHGFKGPYRLGKLPKWAADLSEFDKDNLIMVQGNDVEYDKFVLDTGFGELYMGGEGGITRMTEKAIMNSIATVSENSSKKEEPKPRNFVAKNAKMGGAGQHKDKKKAEKQGNVKHKKPLAEDDQGNVSDTELDTVDPQDHDGMEGSFVKNQIHTMLRVLKHLEHAIGDEEDLPEWVQMKLSQAQESVVGIMNFMISDKEREVERQTGNDALMREELQARLAELKARVEGVGMPFRGVGGAFNRGDDERHDLDPTEWYIVKDGKMFKTTVYPNQVQKAIAQGFSPSREEAKSKADSVEESGLQYSIGVKKHGKDYMTKAAKLMRDGGSQEELGALKDRLSKAYKGKDNNEDVEEAVKKGLYYYVNKRKKAGTSRPASSPKAPTAQAWKDAAKTAKKESADTYFESLTNMLERSVSQAQHNLMVGVANNPQFAQKVKVKQNVGQEFANADVGHDISKLPIRVPKKK